MRQFLKLKKLFLCSCNEPKYCLNLGNVEKCYTMVNVGRIRPYLNNGKEIVTNKAVDNA